MTDDALIAQEADEVRRRVMLRIVPDEPPTCPWCDAPILTTQFGLFRDEAWWHERCWWAHEHGIEKGVTP